MGWTYEVRKHPRFKHVRRLVITLFGVTVLLIGIAMIVLPGPALLVIPLSFAILGTEYVWCRRIFEGMKKHTDKITKRLPKIRRRKKKQQ